MSIYPFYFECERPRRLPSRLVDQHFGLGLTPQDFLTLVAAPRSPKYYRPWRDLQAAADDIGSNIREEKGKFQVNLDVQHFAPDEISVRTADGFLIVEAKHEERRDEHGFISRSFTRRYKLPDSVEPDFVISKLSTDGVLSITAPLKAPPKAANERVVPIVQTGPVKKIESQEAGVIEEKKEEKKEEN